MDAGVLLNLTVGQTERIVPSSNCIGEKAMTDEQIIGMYYDRREEAIKETETRYGKYCLRVADAILKNREDAEECVNDTWLRAWNAIPPAYPKCLRMFLARITRNLSFNRYQLKHTAKRGGGEIEAVLEELEECVADSADIEGQIMAKELGQSITHFVYGLSEREGNVFVRRYFFMEGVAEIAKKYGLKENHVSVILSRTRKALKEHLKKEGYVCE